MSTTIAKNKKQIGRAEIQRVIHSVLRESRNLANEPNDLVEIHLSKHEYANEDYLLAASSVYREIYYRSAKDLLISPREKLLLREVARLLGIGDERIVSLDYDVGLMIYKRTFREAVSDGILTNTEQESLDEISIFFGLRKRDTKKAVSDQALGFYSFLLADALKDGELDSDELMKLEAIANRFGLTKSQLRSLTVPNKKEVLSSALTSIKSRGEIIEADEEYITRLSSFLNANELLAACLKDLNLYKQIFQIREGNIPIIPSDTLMMERGEKLHYAIPISFQQKVGRKLKKRSGTLYVGSLRLRFVETHKSHQIRYKNILSLNFAGGSNPKLSVTVTSGGGGGDYKLAKRADPGLLFEIHEAVHFLIRKAKGLETKRARDTRYISGEVRSEVWYRDCGRCVICGASEYLEYDHIIPLSRGGSTSVDNLQVLCRKCNSNKSDSI